MSAIKTRAPGYYRVRERSGGWRIALWNVRRRWSFPGTSIQFDDAFFAEIDERSVDPNPPTPAAARGAQP